MRIEVDLGGTKTEIIALDEKGATVLRWRVPTPVGDYSGIVRSIVELVLSAQSRIGSIASVGIATPGALSPQTEPRYLWNPSGRRQSPLGSE